ncbi:MAG: pentapeptide repeat-containing protein [Acidobacteriota bacterium]|nr:pentapeptide repeat-containing protein [Acidobacteriota bacterium]MDQ5836559.1 pentapeptide repeat-containing protein [Acidobacteriota bacterium]
MSSSSTTEATTEATPAFICDCDEKVRSACKGLSFYRAYENKQYCVLHYPGKEKSIAFAEALKKKLDAEDFNFRGVRFTDAVNFRKFTFTKPVSFVNAIFEKGANFRSATFSGTANFVHATFSATANFDKAIFSGPVYFVSMTFGKEVRFNLATFNDEVRFVGEEEKIVFSEESSLLLNYARMEHPNRISFHTVRLRPHWFTNVDAREFEFINVTWDWRHITTRKEIKYAEQVIGSPAHTVFSIACRNLAVNAEENHRYEEASRFRYMAMDARRLERWRGFAFWTLGWWYWVASGYGERVWRAFVALIGIWLLAAALYTRVGFARWEPRVATEKEAAEARRDEVGEPLRVPRALTYSLGVMTLQKPEPRPATNAAQSLVMLETILGPVQAALLALAIRRKFMR